MKKHTHQEKTIAFFAKLLLLCMLARATFLFIEILHAAKSIFYAYIHFLKNKRGFLGQTPIYPLFSCKI